MTRFALALIAFIALAPAAGEPTQGQGEGGWTLLFDSATWGSWGKLEFHHVPGRELVEIEDGGQAHAEIIASSHWIRFAISNFSSNKRSRRRATWTSSTALGRTLGTPNSKSGTGFPGCRVVDPRRSAGAFEYQMTDDENAPMPSRSSAPLYRLVAARNRKG